MTVPGLVQKFGVISTLAECASTRVRQMACTVQARRAGRSASAERAGLALAGLQRDRGVERDRGAGSAGGKEWRGRSCRFRRGDAGNGWSDPAEDDAYPQSRPQDHLRL